MNKTLHCTSVSELRSSKICEAINKYSLSTLNYNTSRNVETGKELDSASDKTFCLDGISEEEEELRTYSSIVVGKCLLCESINTALNNEWSTIRLKDTKEKWPNCELRGEMKGESHHRSMLNFIIEQNKNIITNTINISDSIFNVLKIMEDTNKSNELNYLMRKIEHEDIKELIYVNTKLFMLQVRKIYQVLIDLQISGLCNYGTKVDKVSSTYRHIVDSAKEAEHVQNKKDKNINLMVKKYIILKKYYKKLCEKYKMENNLLKRAFIINAKCCNEEYQQKYPFQIDGICTVSYMNNKILKKYNQPGEGDSEVTPDVIDGSKKVQVNLEKCNGKCLFLLTENEKLPKDCLERTDKGRPSNGASINVDDIYQTNQEDLPALVNLKKSNKNKIGLACTHGPAECRELFRKKRAQEEGEEEENEKEENMMEKKEDDKDNKGDNENGLAGIQNNKRDDDNYITFETRLGDNSKSVSEMEKNISGYKDINTHVNIFDEICKRKEPIHDESNQKEFQTRFNDKEAVVVESSVLEEKGEKKRAKGEREKKWKVSQRKEEENRGLDSDKGKIILDENSKESDHFSVQEVGEAKHVKHAKHAKQANQAK
ncbi:conserved Plasmodium protein, unknown function [Plasmodium malariae]|uniref:Uncharacterized protein n=2 Tax=Plasmodium malariae TaxID=5858 RepID=A0A1D3JJH9_PLAMA|nr:conserved Plasmodium protein, unknown function [Plasmodium malariae]SBT86578.1 conserved Plasmodium protein, unknown function [Plasmodium malariae]